MNLGEQLRTVNLKRALEIVDSLPQHKGEIRGPKYSRRSKELAKWQAAAYCLAAELRRLSITVTGEP